MAKRVFLYVYGGDYSAVEFDGTYDEQIVYEEMVKEGETHKIIEGEDDFYAEVEIKEFDDIDDDFINFMKNRLCDYDNLKASDIFEVKPL